MFWKIKQSKLLLKIYICIPQSETFVEHGFLKMNVILRKKRTGLDKDTLDALMTFLLED